MDVRLGPLVLSLFFVSVASSQTGNTRQQTVPLVVPAGVPLRVYLTKRVSKRLGEPVQGKLIEPVYAFDREVIPAGTAISGRVSRVDPVSRSQRFRAVFAGDLTPLHVAEIEFTSLVLPGGRQIPVQTVESEGLDTVVPLHPPKKTAQPAQNNTGVIGAGKQRVKDQISSQIDQVKSIPDLVRAPGKKERIEDFLLAKLPYHPQYIRNGTRFDAELSRPIGFGSEPVKQGSLALVGTQPTPDAIAHTRLITPLDSHSTKQGDKVEVEVMEPVFSSDHKLVLPQGTLLDGTVVVARKARWFHRAGRLRFNFQRLTLPLEVAQLESVPAAAMQRQAQDKLHVRTQATLKAAEGGKEAVKVDSEGGVQAKESKTRFIGTAAAIMLARRSGDLDPIRSKSGTVIGQNQNVAGRTVGGGFGFGLLGAAASQSSRYVGAAFGYYGMAWAVFSTVISRGSEVQFAKNAVIDIGFNPRIGTPKKLLASSAPASN
jgi:hypothetical protein